MDSIQVYLKNPIVIAALGGLLAAAKVDFDAFKTWKSFNDLTSYQWKTALFRWGQGAAIGALAALGLGFGATS